MFQVEGTRIWTPAPFQLWGVPKRAPGRQSWESWESFWGICQGPTLWVMFHWIIGLDFWESPVKHQVSPPWIQAAAPRSHQSQRSPTAGAEATLRRGSNGKRGSLCRKWWVESGWKWCNSPKMAELVRLNYDEIWENPSARWRVHAVESVGSFGFGLRRKGSTGNNGA